MKKLFFSAAILAALASCSKEEAVDMSQSKQIGFYSLNDRVTTKAANDSGESFRIFATKGETASAWYIKDHVDYGTSATALAPENGPYYWPTDGSAISFYAYAPYNSGGTNNVTESLTDATAISLTYTVPSGAQEDFTVASPQAIASANFPTDGTVDLIFKHMLSKITVKVEPSDTFDINNYISDGTGEVDTDSPFSATFTAVSNTITVDATEATPVAKAATNVGDVLAYDSQRSYYIAPQDFANCSLQINGITIRDKATHSELFSGDLDVITFDGSELNGVGAAFESGKHYVFTVTIDAASTDLVEIQFTAESSANWGDSDTEIEVN